jgi:hypothetical protein
MVRLEVRITPLQTFRNVPAGATTGTVSVPTTADTLMKWRNFHIASEECFATGQLSTRMRLLWQRSLLLRLRRIWCGINFTLSNPSAWRHYLYFVTNGTAGSADYTTTNVIVTVPAEQLLERYRYQQLRITWWSDENFSIALELFLLRVQLTIMMRLLWQRSLCFGYRRIWCGIQLYLEQPFWVDITYTFVWLNGTAGVRITPLQTLM